MTFDLASLAPFLGLWRGTGDIAPNPWGGAGPSRGVWSFRFDPSGHNLIHDYEETRADGTIFSGHGVWCIQDQDLLHFWFDSYGFAPLAPARGGWAGDRLVVTKTTPRGQGRSTWTCEGKDMHYIVEAWPAGDDGFVRIASGVYSRVAGL